MAGHDFVHPIRVAASVLAAGPADDPRAVARWTAARGLWLTPVVADAYVAGVEQLARLPTEVGRAAARAERFRATAADLADREPTPAEVAEAARQLDDLIRPIAGYSLEPEGEAVIRALWAGPVPEFVLGLDYDLDTDWTGDPAAHIRVIIRDDADPESDEFQEFVVQFDDRLFDAMREARSNRFPYAGFLPESDARAALAGGPA